MSYSGQTYNNEISYDPNPTGVNAGAATALPIAMTPKQQEAEVLIKELRVLASAFPERASTISIISAVNKLVKKLRLPISMQGTEVAFLLWELILTLLKVNVWTWAENEMEDPGKSVKVGALLSTFVAIIPLILSYIHLVLSASDTPVDGKLFFKNAFVQISTLVIVPTSYAMVLSNLSQIPEDFSTATQQALMGAAFLTMTEIIGPPVSTAFYNLATGVYHSALRPLAKRLQDSPCFRRWCNTGTAEERRAILPQTQRSIPVLEGMLNTSHESSLALLEGNKAAKRIIKTLEKYDSLPYQFLFVLVFLFIMKTLYKPFAAFMSGDIHSENNYAAASILGTLTLVVCITAGKLEKKLTEWGKHPH